MTCPTCVCIAAALAEVGMDPRRVMCNGPDGGNCWVGCGLGTEGLPADEVERRVDKAIALCARARTEEP